MNIIAKKITYKRKVLGMTQRELAEKLNVSDKTLSRWETGKQIPDALMIPQIADALEMTINEIYGAEDEESENDSQIIYEPEETIDYGRISSYKIALLAGVSIFVLGNGIFAYTSIAWDYVKGGAIILMLIGLFVFLAGELTFEEFYLQKVEWNYYRDINFRWFATVALIVVLITGLVIPIIKPLIITLCNGWEVILPVVIFQGIALWRHTKRISYEIAEESDRSKSMLGYIFVLLGFICTIGFIITTLSNSNPKQGGIIDTWQSEHIWLRIKGWEIGAGFAFLSANFTHAKKELGMYGKSFKKLTKNIGLFLAGIVLTSAVIVAIVNHNLQSKIRYTAVDIPKMDLIEENRDLYEWIQECNLSGHEFSFLTGFKVDWKTLQSTTSYLIYLPHGCDDTKLDMKYQIGLNTKKLRIKAQNTTPIVDDKYYLCYLEVKNSRETLEIQTYLDDEREGYHMDSSIALEELLDERCIEKFF